MKLEDIELEIKRYRPEAGDLLVVKLDRVISQHDAERVRMAVLEEISHTGARVLVVQPGTTVEVFRAEAFKDLNLAESGRG
jgi:hypothetical protein